MLTVMRSAAATARVAISSEERRSFCSKRARMERASPGASVDTARNWNRVSCWTKTSTAGECSSTRRRSAMLSITDAVSGKPCSAVATSTRMLARRRSSRESWFKRRASSAVPSWAAKMVTLATASSSKPAWDALCTNAMAPTTSPETSSGAAMAACAWHSASQG